MQIECPKKLSKEGYKAFRKAYREEYGLDINEEDANEIARLLFKRIVCVFNNDK